MLYYMKLPTVSWNVIPFHIFVWILLWLDYPLFFVISLLKDPAQTKPSLAPSLMHTCLSESLFLFFCIVLVYSSTSPAALWVLKYFYIDLNWQQLALGLTHSKCSTIIFQVYICKYSYVYTQGTHTHTYIWQRMTEISSPLLCKTTPPRHLHGVPMIRI